MKKLSIDQVAELAFVSRSVVSRVLNNHDNVSDEARERVLEVVKKYNYQPSSIARGLVKKKSFEIGILAPRGSDETLGNGFWSILYLGIFDECTAKGYFVTFSHIPTDEGAEINEQILDKKRLDGYILLTEEVTGFVINKLIEQEVPFVLVGHNQHNYDFNSIDVNNYSGVEEATDHLVELGHKRIGVIMGNSNTQQAVDRLNGFKATIKKRGLTVLDKYIAMDDYSQRHGYETIRKWVQEGMDITAVVCTSDTLAMGALLALNQENISVPEEFSVLGFDDLPIAQYTIPPLTTVQQPIYEKGKLAAKILVNQIEKSEAKVVHENLEAKLIIRNSTGPAPR